MSNETCTLVINRSDSYCAGCGNPCDPDESSHETILGWPATRRQRAPCHRRYTHVRSDYPGMKATVTTMRPDLEWAGFDE